MTLANESFVLNLFPFRAAIRHSSTLPPYNHISVKTLKYKKALTCGINGELSNRYKWELNPLLSPSIGYESIAITTEP